MTTSPPRIAALVTSAAVLALPLSTTLLTAADASVKPKSYANCTELHKDYPHGVGRKGAHDHTRSGSNPVTNFTVSTKVYSYNDGQARHPGERDLDRDNDGIACEKH